MKSIKYLKQQSRQGGVPLIQSPQQISSNVLALAQQLANQMVAESAASQNIFRNGRTFTQFDLVNDVVANQIETVTAGVWSDNAASLTTYFTSSIETAAQRRYYIDVYQANPSSPTAAVQYALAFGHALGSGSDSQGQLNDSPSKAIYSQYRQLLLNQSDTRFTTAGSGSTDYIYVINFKRNRIKEALDPGNWELPLIGISSRATNATGSVVTGSSSTIIKLIDDSSITTGATTTSGKVYNIVSGSLNNGVFNSSAPHYYGLVYPDMGMIILNGENQPILSEALLLPVLRKKLLFQRGPFLKLLVLWD